MASSVDRRSKGAVNFRRTAGSGSLRNTASALIATEVAQRYRFHSAVIPLPYGSRRPGRGHAFWSFKWALQAGPLGGLFYLRRRDSHAGAREPLALAKASAARLQRCGR